jgi:hypothetical protein
MALGTLPFNPSCSAAINRIVCEPHSIALNKKSILADEGPLFSKTLEVSYIGVGGSSRVLEYAVDYVYAYPLVKKGSDALHEPIVCGVVLEPSLSGSVTFSYNALGGDFGITSAHITAMNSVIAEPADSNYEAAIRHALTTPLIINAWPAETLSTYNTAIKDKITASGVSVTPYTYTL